MLGMFDAKEGILDKIADFGKKEKKKQELREQIEMTLEKIDYQ